jgi:signal transduction histidine kinase
MVDAKRDRRERSEGSAATRFARQRAIAERLLLTALHERDARREAVEASKRATFLASASRDLAMSLDESTTREAVRRRALPREGSWCMVAIDAEAKSPTDRGEFDPGRLLVVPLVVRGAVLGAITYVTRDGDPPFSPEETTLASDLADICALALDNARLYREAQALRDAAEAANRAKSSFLGNMSHELMTPLNAIGGYVTLIQMGLRGPVSAEQQVDLVRIRHNQMHLLTLISEILTFVRSEGGKLEYRFTEVSVQGTLHDISDMLQGAIDERHVMLIQRPVDVDVAMWADADRLRQILLNLVMNAVKYSAVVGGQITLSVTSTSHSVAIHVSDNGPGIPGDKLAVIFEPFVQLASGLTDRRGGVGLGLSISRDLARAMHGELTVESTVGAGSRFTLELPRARHTSARSP